MPGSGRTRNDSHSQHSSQAGMITAPTLTAFGKHTLSTRPSLFTAHTHTHTHTHTHHSVRWKAVIHKDRRTHSHTQYFHCNHLIAHTCPHMPPRPPHTLTHTHMSLFCVCYSSIHTK